MKIWYDTEGNITDLESVSTKSTAMSYIQGFSDISSAKSSIAPDDKGVVHIFRAMISLFKKDKEVLNFYYLVTINPYFYTFALFWIDRIAYQVE